MTELSDSTSSGESAVPEIQVYIKGPNELRVQISITLDSTVRDLKDKIAEKADVPADRQRLIYSGHVLKDDDLLSSYKIQTQHTIHMVKSAARPGTSSDSTSGSTSTSRATPGVGGGLSTGQIPNMQTGQIPMDPLTHLNGPMGHGLPTSLNPFGDLGLNTNDPNMMLGVLDNPQFLQQMSNLMSNPGVLDALIASNPQLAAMGPQVRQFMQSDAFRQMFSNPNALRSMLRFSQLMRDAGFGPGGLGSPGSGGGFPAPGMPSYTQNQSQQGQATAQSQTQGPPDTATSTTSPPSPSAAGGGPDTGNNVQNPYAALAGLFSPELPLDSESLPFGALLSGPGRAATAGSPADTRSMEERFATQLQQLQDMGFTDAAQNVRALLATGGNVHAAVEYILGGGGL